MKKTELLEEAAIACMEALGRLNQKESVDVYELIALTNQALELAKEFED